MDAEALRLIRDLRPALKDLHQLDPAGATRTLLATLALIVAVGALAAWGAALGGAGWLLVVVAALLMAPVQHRIGVLGHEAAHGLLYRRRTLNTVLLYLLAGGIGSPPETYRAAHLTHHAYLGEDADQERPNYRNPPRGLEAFARWLALRLTGLEPAARLLHLLFAARGHGEEGRIAQPGVPLPAVPRSDWAALAGVQLVILGGYAVTIGWWFYPLLWLLPLFTVSRAVVNVRAFVEHLWDAEAERRGAPPLISFDSGPLERFVLGPLFFHYHAEHHLFPRIPTWRLAEAKDRIRAHPDYAGLVRRYPSYRAALARYFSA